MAEFGWLVPDDWNGIDFTNYCLCAPDSRQWRATVEGAVYLLGRARQWDASTGNVTEAAALGKDVYFSMAQCDEALAEINASIQALSFGSTASGCGCPDSGTSIDPAEKDDNDVSIGPGEQFPNEAAYLEAKCNVANAIQFNVQNVIRQLEAYNVDDKFTVFLSVTSAIVIGALTAGIVGAVAGFAIGVSSAIISALVLLNKPDLEGILTEMDNSREELVCALVEAASASAAKAAYIAVLDGTSLTTLQKAIVTPMLTNLWLNQLFTPDGALVTFDDYPAWYVPTDCSTCNLVPTVQLIFSGVEGIDSGVIVGSNSLLVGQQVLVDSIEETIGCPGRHVIALNLLDAGGLALQADVVITTTGWSDFCIHSGCVTNLTIFAPGIDFAGGVTTIACSVDPDGGFVGLTSYGPRSDTPFQIEINRTA